MLPEANTTDQLFHRHSSDVARGGESLSRRSHAILDQWDHPLVHRESQSLGGSRSSLDARFPVFRGTPPCRERHAPLEAGSVAGLAASSTGQTPLGVVLDAERGPVLRAMRYRQSLWNEVSGWRTFPSEQNPNTPAGRPGKGTPMMTVVQTQEGAQGSD